MVKIYTWPFSITMGQNGFGSNLLDVGCGRENNWALRKYIDCACSYTVISYRYFTGHPPTNNGSNWYNNGFKFFSEKSAFVLYK